MKLKINSVPGYTGNIAIQTDSEGIPLDRFWRNRLKDAETDNCCEIITKPKKEKASDPN